MWLSVIGQGAIAAGLAIAGEWWLAGVSAFGMVTTLGYLSLLGIVWRQGWLAGRAAFAGAMAEAMRRGMHPVEFLMAEAERDGATLVIRHEPDPEADQ